MILTRDNHQYSKKNLSQCHFAHHNPTWIGLGPNWGPLNKRPETSGLRSGTALSICHPWFVT